ncbi:cilia- and flagella-associated protein 44 isoform X1 [Osmia bicornis bicornis]|uniref:cilia- and flagella-associated protein 44 isoform X1 n=1 Tax=Osmia bicornis bicornis TaxID=1437191 RepID=UPI0010F7EE6C|nr:cilia- and flagella-associated protein 44 isoform X1 [Osmia bicornis bicornis]
MADDDGIEFKIDEKIYVDEYSSMGRKPENGTISENILNFFYSYAYNCRKYFNLCRIDSNIIAFASGNLIQFFNITENKIWFKKASIGNSIGHISKNPVSEHIAVGVNGKYPLIAIYNWPSMKIITVLEGGTTKCYSYLTYSPDGLLLASQGGEPDYYVSIWNWKESRIILQCKSYVQDVYNITFSKYTPGQLTSSGVGHIKFWKICRTFTGLKLKGNVGKFGNTEMSDIIAIHPMPNETVISGCEWGNILLWDESLIKLEACRKNKETAHINYITQFEYINGELISVGSDGLIRFWFYETIDHANLSDEEKFLEIQPIYEFEIADREENAMLMCIQKQEPDDPEKTDWYAQDGNGGLWLLDLCTNKKEHIQRKIFTCHAGPIVDMDVADWGPFLATLDKNGNLHIYNYIEKKLNITHKFNDIGSQVIWFPCKIEETGSTLVCAFESGVIRMITISIQASSTEDNIKGDYTRLIEVLKPHSMSITVMCLNTSCSLLVTGGNDATIFAFSIQSTKIYPKILPIGYVKVPSPVTCMTWNPQEEATILIGCLRGDCVEIHLPTIPQLYTTTSYELVKCSSATFKFESIKSSIQRDIVKKEYEKRKEEKVEEKRKEMEQLMAENPHIVIDEEAFLMEIEEEEMILPEIYIPEVPNQILVAEYGVNGNIWLFMAGFDAGYIYEYLRPLSGKMKHHTKPITIRIIENAIDTEIYNFLFYKNREYLFLGTEHGELYISKVNEEDPLDLSDYWILPIHDYYNGRMSKILFSYNKTMLLTCGHDGNIFSFNINDDTPDESIIIPKPTPSFPLPKNIEDIEDPEHPSLEQVITQREHNRIMSIAERKKKAILQIIRDLTEEFVTITTRNKNLLPSQQILQFELDHRITADLKQQLKAHITLTRKKLEYQMEKSKLELRKLMNHFVTSITCLPFAVRGILHGDKEVYSLRELKLNIINIAKCIEKMKHSEMGRKTDTATEEMVEMEKYESYEEELQQIDVLLGEDYSDLSTGLGLQIKQVLMKYKDQKLKLFQRQQEWQKLNAKKPNLEKSRLEDAAFLDKAKETIGEYNLKINTGFNLMKKKETAVSKYKQLLDCRSKLYYLREDFNEKLRSIRSEKQKLLKEVNDLTEILKRIHMELPWKNIKPLPDLPKLNVDTEFPEHHLEIEKYMSMSEKMEQVKQRKQSTVNQLGDPFDLEYEALYGGNKRVFGDEAESLATLVSSSKMKMTHSDLLQSLTTNDSFQTTWEREMKRSRMWRKLYEQDCILHSIDVSYKKLENELNELEEYRLYVTYRSIYMNLYLLTLYEEFIILRECEATERTLEKKVDEKLNERSTVMLKIQTTNVNISMKEDEIRKLHTRSKDIAAEFAKAIFENKFHDFLQKIFKKKYTATRERDDSLDSETQSSETSSEESDDTVDSETEHIPLDESICPSGCDKDLYEMAFFMREKRYECEFQIKEKQREIELLHKELETDTKHLKVIDNSLKSNQAELQEFVLKKQRKLNEIDVTIVLKLHQLQHMSDSEHMTELQNCVLFNKKELSNLYSRIGELQEETYNLEEKRRKNETHLKRIKLDLKYMESENKKLKEDIKEKMIQKFGREVSLINLYETILQRLIYDTKTDVRKIMKNYNKDIKSIKENYDEALIVLENVIRDNTEKLSLLTILEKEKNKLRKDLERVLIPKENMVQTELEYKADINMLENILDHQMQQKKLLQYDIENLKTGGRKLPPICMKDDVL